MHYLSHEREEREETANLYEQIMANFSNLEKKLDIQFQKAQRTSTKRKLEVYTETHFNQIVKNKERVLKQ